MKVLKNKAIENYLSDLFKKRIEVKKIEPLGRGSHGQGFSIEFKQAQTIRRLILKRLRGDIGLGHDYPSDRAALFLLAKRSYNLLSKHVRAVDVATLKEDGSIRSVEEGEDFFLLMEEAKGECYFKDLEMMKSKSRLDSNDRKRIKTLVKYLSEIHSVRKRSKPLYLRKIRDIIGHGECLMGVLDSYGPVKFTSLEEMAEIERKCIGWRMSLKLQWKRLCQVHGDFHPGNIWFISDKDFSVLDRSRGLWGDAADDVTALTINYIFFSINYHGKFVKPYDDALRLFYDEYITLTGDEEILGVVAPFYAFRGVVVANPLFYPKVKDENRKKIFRFIHHVLDSERFDPENVRID